MSSPADSEPAPRSSGEVLAKRYRLLTPIGEGGMGVVWSAEHALTGKRVAVKLLATLRPDVKRRFIREAKVVAALRHRNIVQVHDVLETHDGTPAMVMDLLEGETLEQRLDALGRVGLEEAVGILVPVVDAI
ncbi:MAG: protein kinase, partial [Myxococcota bacterium]